MYPLGMMRKHVEALDHEQDHPEHVHGDSGSIGDDCDGSC